MAIEGYQSIPVSRGETALLQTTDKTEPLSSPQTSCRRITRIVGVQSGNAVDGLDVGIFDFWEEPAFPEDTLATEKIESKRSEGEPRNFFLGGLKAETRLRYKTLANKTFSYNQERRNYILNLRKMNLDDGKAYAEANYEFGRWCGEAVNALIEDFSKNEEFVGETTEDQLARCKASIDFVSSHGQTISGHPHWEIGDLNVIAQVTGLTAVGDFRTADVAVGGKGTPCTCTYDSIFLRPNAMSTEAFNDLRRASAGSHVKSEIEAVAKYSKWRICINIGGTSSVTFCPPWELGDAEAVPRGLDPGLGVFFMDLCAQRLIVRHPEAGESEVGEKLDYDPNGDIGRLGTVDEDVLAYFLDYKYYKQNKLPIGVGPDDFPEKLFETWVEKAKEIMGVNSETSKNVTESSGCAKWKIDLLATLTELTTRQIALACKRWGGKEVVGRGGKDGKGGPSEVILRGGVCNNSFFVERLAWNLSEQLASTDAEKQKPLFSSKDMKILADLSPPIDEESWENAMYATFGYLCVHNVYNFVPSCTGADQLVVGGKIAPGKNFQKVMRKI
eukprot:TRINITY_DN10364_c0_g1_i1.p1 TRINITY_DN10364_c0_g1~~TRINITY_DN10364_c0_g1_i1.p1  ORF type:complete len:558 (-),score=103.53 TRINITY_DN10364_c0_g1_i1:32-1705(-)